METGKKEKVDENVETQNKTRKSKKQTMGEKKQNEERDVKRKTGQTGVVRLMVMVKVLTF